MKKNSLWVGIAVVAILIVIGIFWMSTGNKTANAPTDTNNPPASNTNDQNSGAVTVSLTANGFEPKELTIKRGETVTFINNSSQQMWVASDPHPTHTGYPGSNIQLCGGSAIIFDECMGLGNGSGWSFIFSKVGTWGYHNHLVPNFKGTITVTE